MKILVYGINFAPELTGIGKYTSEMVKWLVDAGHEVRVVAAPPYYPQWQVGEGYSAKRYATEDWQGAKVWRCPLWVPPFPGGKRRLLHLFSFAITSLPVMLRQAFWRPDLVWVAAPAFACTPAAVLTAWLSGARSWLHVQDFEVDVAFDLGLLKGERRRKLVTGIERWLLRRFDVVSSISRRMTHRATEKGISNAKAVLFPNWVDTNKFNCEARSAELRAELGIAPDAFVALFSGTLGAKQGLTILPEVAERLQKTCPRVVIVVSGDGVMKARLEQAGQELSNFKLLPLQPTGRFLQLMAVADCHLLTQDPGVADLVMPSKLGGMLASGRPVVATVDLDTEVGFVMNGRGLIVEPGDAANLSAAIEKLANDSDLCRRLANAARKFAEAELDAARVLQHAEAQFKHLVRNKSLRMKERLSA